MITRNGIGTLAAGGGIIAAVVCLLVGLQLLLLGSEIGTWIQADPTGADPAARAWQGLVRVSGLLALVAAGLVLLLVTAHRRGWRPRQAHDPGESSDVEDVSVRIFEVDPTDGTVEVTPRNEGAGIGRPSPARTPLDSAEDASRDILDEIDRVARTRPDGPSGSWRGFLARFFGRK